MDSDSLRDLDSKRLALLLRDLDSDSLTEMDSETLRDWERLVLLLSDTDSDLRTLRLCSKYSDKDKL